MAAYEYCVLSGVGHQNRKLEGVRNGALWLLGADGYSTHDISTNGADWAATVAGLGNDGWEMVGAQNGLFFFKRPKPEAPGV